MNSLAIYVVILFQLSFALYFSTAVAKRLEKSSYSFLKQVKGCPNDPLAYWSKTHPKFCIPPPSDEESPVAALRKFTAICLFVRALNQSLVKPFPFKSPSGQELSCK